MRLGQVSLRTTTDAVTHFSKIAYGRKDVRPLWFSVPKEYGELVSSRSDAALLASLIPAMRRGGDLHVRGTLTDEFYYALSGEFQEMLLVLLSKLKRVRILPEDLAPVEGGAQGVATGFSAGVDSWQVLAEYFVRDAVPDSLRVTHLLYNNLGSHGRGGNEVFRRRLASIRQAGAELGLPVIPVDTNMADLYPKMKFSRTHTPRNASVALLLSAGVRRFYYASAYHLQHVAGKSLGANGGIAKADPITLPALSTTGLQLQSVGGPYTRVEKTLQMAEVEPSHRYLDVCIAPRGEYRNCTRCWKCRRTALTLDIAGVLPQYESVFDLQYWGRSRRWAWEWAKQEKDSLLEQEVVAFGQKNGYAP